MELDVILDDICQKLTLLVKAVEVWAEVQGSADPWPAWHTPAAAVYSVIHGDHRQEDTHQLLIQVQAVKPVQNFFFCHIWTAGVPGSSGVDWQGGDGGGGEELGDLLVYVLAVLRSGRRVTKYEGGKNNCWQYFAQMIHGEDDCGHSLSMEWQVGSDWQVYGVTQQVWENTWQIFWLLVAG